MDRDELGKIRSVFFPTIALQIVTGFNIYKDYKPFNDYGKNIIISYLHTDLTKGKSHFEQIKRMLEEYTDRITIQRIKHEVISRDSSYGVKAGWETDEYFLPNQKPVKKEDVRGLLEDNVTVIGCEEQNELLIKCEKEALEHILEKFRLHLNRHEIDAETGEAVMDNLTGKKKFNPRAWDNAWEIPPIIISGVDRDIKSYERVKKINFDMPHDMVSLIIGGKWDKPPKDNTGRELFIPSLKDYLKMKNLNPTSVDYNHLTNKIFFDLLEYTDWEKVDKSYKMFKELYE